MFCSNCGKQIQDGGKFCSECGAPLTAPAGSAQSAAPAAPPAPVEWIHYYYETEFKGGRYTLSQGQSEQVARSFFWNNYQAQILPDLQRYLDYGWQPISEVGPSGFLFTTSNLTYYLKKFRVKLRKQRTDPPPEYQLKILGTWQFVDLEKRGFKAQLAAGLGSVAGLLPRQLFFSKDYMFSRATERNSHTGVYSFSDPTHLRVDIDVPPASVRYRIVENTQARLSLEELEGVEVIYHFQKAG